jgi:hypothetical protein
VFPDFAVSHALPAFAKTTVELTQDRSGQFGFACGMNMVHGTLIVEPTNRDRVDGPRYMVRIAGLEMHPKDRQNRTGLLHGAAGLAMCNITKCCPEVCPRAHPAHGQRDHPAKRAGRGPLLRSPRLAEPQASGGSSG